MAWAPVEQAVTTAWFGPFRPCPNGDVAARQIDQTAWDEERRQPPRTLLLQQQCAVVDAAETTDPGADHDTGLDLLFVGFGGPIRIRQRLGRCTDGEKDEVVDLALLFRLKPIVRIELALGRIAPRNLGRDAAGQVRHFEIADRGGSAVACRQSPPGRIGISAQRCHQTDAGDDDASRCVHSTLPRPRCGPCGPVLPNGARRSLRRRCSPQLCRGLHRDRFEAVRPSCSSRGTARHHRPSRWSRQRHRGSRHRTPLRTP